MLIRICDHAPQLCLSVPFFTITIRLSSLISIQRLRHYIDPDEGDSTFIRSIGNCCYFDTTLYPEDNLLTSTCLNGILLTVSSSQGLLLLSARSVSFLVSLTKLGPRQEITSNNIGLLTSSFDPRPS
jgi:hypothetical protein